MNQALSIDPASSQRHHTDPCVVPMADELKRALREGEFALHYQPKADVRSGGISGFEALLRWQHPSRGMLAPGEFIPALEHSGLIVEAGLQVLREACRQARIWADAGFGDLNMAVNLSGLQLREKNLDADVAAILAETGFDSHNLELELTETTLMQDQQQAVQALRQLKNLGLRVSVDDFGTGYSSLSYLKRFPIDVVKIDKSFIDGITVDPNDAMLTRAMISMMHDLHLKVVAEGVETEGQLAMLVAGGCDLVQGYYFSRPVPADEATAMLKSGKRIERTLLQRSGGKRTLLLVDDEENILSALKRLLRRDGYNILTAKSAAEGLEILARNEVGVIVSDQRMPQMTGVEFLRRVRQIHPHTVRMVLSGFAELESVTGAINEGAIYKFLTKPWDDEQLRANIDEAFQRCEIDRENRLLGHQVDQAQEQLAQANRRLARLVEQKQSRIARDEVTLDVTHEILRCLPLPVVGVDDEGIVVIANPEAQLLFLGNGLAVGDSAERGIPPELFAMFDSGEQSTAVEVEGRAYTARCHRMGAHSRSRGHLLILTPAEAA